VKIKYSLPQGKLICRICEKVVFQNARVEVPLVNKKSEKCYVCPDCHSLMDAAGYTTVVGYLKDEGRLPAIY
jgi:uncharacterized protein YlaI